MKLGMKNLAALAMMLLGTVAGGCASDTDDDADGDFIAESTDEALDAADPPNDPDPADPVVTKGTCPDRGNLLSPKGLTFILHFSKHKEQAQKELAHLKEIKPYLRGRDIFMVEHTSPILGTLQKEFPCNEIHYIAYPDELQAALQTGGRIDGINVDWEGGQVTGHGAQYSIDKLKGYANKIWDQGKIASFTPAWPASFDDGKIAKASNMQYELAQIQGACVNGPARFGDAAKRSAKDFKEHHSSARNIGFEISLDSVNAADNHVGPARAADCTRAAFGKGARAIYIYGNGNDHLVDYFHGVGKMGLRAKR